MVSDFSFAPLYYQTKFDGKPKPKHFIFLLLAVERDSGVKFNVIMFITYCILATPNCAVISDIGTLCGAVAVCAVSFLNHL